MRPKLSIIMPCYNSQRTLAEAVDSCFAQQLEDFEIVLADDASSDSTPDMIEEIARAHPNVKCVLRKENGGGGAARNSAVRAAEGDLIFCLDSDDILPPGMLGKMIDCLVSQSLDGVLFETTHFFEDGNRSKTEIVRNRVRDRDVDLADLFDPAAGFLSKVNFMYTRKLYDLAGGYPEDHGFDTQTFGHRALLCGGRIRVCPGSHYLHRRDRRNASYFMREFAQGKLSYNTYLMLEDFVHLLSDRAIAELLDYDIVNGEPDKAANLAVFSEELFKKLSADAFFIASYRTYLVPDSMQEYAKSDMGERSAQAKQLIRFVHEFRNGRHESALDSLLPLLEAGKARIMPCANMVRCVMRSRAVAARAANDAAFSALRRTAAVSPAQALARRISRKIKALWNR